MTKRTWEWCYDQKKEETVFKKENLSIVKYQPKEQHIFLNTNKQTEFTPTFVNDTHLVNDKYDRTDNKWYGDETSLGETHLFSIMSGRSSRILGTIVVKGRHAVNSDIVELIEECLCYQNPMVFM